MAVTNYYSINGQIIGESTSGVRTDYLTDALGSVTGTVNQSGVVINTYRYKPYGDLLSKTGTGADPAFGWAGSQGYKQTQKKFSNFYVRARHYGSAQGRWTTVDPLWFTDTSSYAYVRNNPSTSIDPSGFQLAQPKPPILFPLPPINPIPLPPPTNAPTPSPLPWWLLRCCLIGGLLICPLPAGPKPRIGKSCRDLYPEYPKSGSVYYKPNWPNAYSGSTCDDAIASAVAAIRRAFPGIAFKSKEDESLDGPCPGIGLHVVLQSRGRGKSHKIATIVCCPTCDDLPEVEIGVPGCKCGILRPVKGDEERSEPWGP